MSQNNTQSKVLDDNHTYAKNSYPLVKSPKLKHLDDSDQHVQHKKDKMIIEFKTSLFLLLALMTGLLLISLFVLIS